MAACAVAGGWLWVRDSSLVAVRDVYVTGVSSSEGPQIRSALRNAALDMTTLHVREDALRTAAAQYPSIKGFDVDADFPHKLSIVVHERAAVAAIQSGGATVAASARRARPARDARPRAPDPARALDARRQARDRPAHARRARRRRWRAARVARPHRSACGPARAA